MPTELEMFLEAYFDVKIDNPPVINDFAQMKYLYRFKFFQCEYFRF